MSNSKSAVRRLLTRMAKRDVLIGLGSLLAVLVLLVGWQGDTVTLLNHQNPQTAGQDGSRELGVALADSSQADSQPDTGFSQPAPEALPAAADVCVHISGAVADPGVVRLPDGSRLVDAVELCGGLGDDAASDYINLAALLVDGTHLYIPSKADIEAWREQGLDTERQLQAGSSEAAPSSPVGPGSSAGRNAAGSNSANAQGSSDAGASQLVDINSADAMALQTVPGIGPVTAQRIIDYRQQNGRFNQVDDLLLISGIGQKKLANMRPYLECR